MKLSRKKKETLNFTIPSNFSESLDSCCALIICVSAVAVEALFLVFGHSIAHLMAAKSLEPEMVTQSRGRLLSWLPKLVSKPNRRTQNHLQTDQSTSPAATSTLMRPFLTSASARLRNIWLVPGAKAANSRQYQRDGEAVIR